MESSAVEAIVCISRKVELYDFYFLSLNYKEQSETFASFSALQVPPCANAKSFTIRNSFDSN